MARAEGGAVRGLTLAFVAQAVLVIIGLWALASALWLARDVFFVAFFAVLVATFLSLFVDPLVRYGARRGVAVLLVLAGVAGLLGGAGVLVWPVLQEQAALVQQQLPRLLEQLERAVTNGAAVLSGSPGGNADLERQLQQRVHDELASLVGGTLPLLNTVLGLLGGLALVVAAGAFLALEPRTYLGGLLRLVPGSRRPKLREALPLAARSLRQWIKGTALGMLAVGGLSVVGLTIIGVPAALALGLIAALLAFVPYIGPTASFVPAVAVALTVSPGKAIAVVVLYTLIQFVESFLLTPLLMKGMVRLPPALTLLFQSFMAVLFGFLGLLLAVPTLAFGKVLVEQLYVEPVADEK